jgi:hypothetical protein
VQLIEIGAQFVSGAQVSVCSFSVGGKDFLLPLSHASFFFIFSYLFWSNIFCVNVDERVGLYCVE